MNITLLFNKLADDVNRSLYIIAKRSKDADGKPLYSDLTLSTAEQPLLNDFFRDAIVMLNTESQHFITASELSDDEQAPAVTLTFPDNHNNAMNTTITLAVASFCVAYALYAWFSVVEPKLVERYKQELADKLAAVIRLIWHKAPPATEYTYDLPPRVNTPGDTITLVSGEQVLIGYTHGSDRVDDLFIQSSAPTIVSAAKNENNRVFSIMALAGFDSETTAVITVIRSTTNIELARITVKAVPASSSQSVTYPVLVGYQSLSDHVSVNTGSNVDIPYTGTITRRAVSNDNVSVSFVGNVIRVNGLQQGNAVVTLFAANGWSYTLFVTVAAAQATSPSFTVDSQLSLTSGQSTTINYTLGSDNVDDLIIRAADTSVISVSKSTANRRFTITALSSGSSAVTITSASHPEVNTSFSVVVAAAQQQLLPTVYGFENAETVNTVVGADAIRVYYYPGSQGSMSISASPSGSVNLTPNNVSNYVDISPLTAGDVTITFANATMDWSRTLRLAIAQRPTVITPPMLFWPTSIRLEEAGASQTVEYALGNDGQDTIYMAASSITAPDGSAVGSSQLDTYISIVKDSANHQFTLIPLKACTAVIRVYDTVHGISEYHTVDIDWVEPQVLGYESGDTVTLSDIYESGGEIEEGINALRIQYRVPSSGNVTVSYLPSGSAATHEEETVPSNHGRALTSLVIKALREGQTYVTLSCPTPSGDTWSFRLKLNIGSATVSENATIRPTSLNLTAGGSAGTLTVTGGTLLSAQSSNTDLATVAVSGNVITVTPLAAGTVYIHATTVGGNQLSVACLVQAAAVQSYVPPTFPSGYNDGAVINLQGNNDYVDISIDIRNSSDNYSTLSAYSNDGSKVEVSLIDYDSLTVKLRVRSLTNTNETVGIFVTSNHPSADGWEIDFDVNTNSSASVSPSVSGSTSRSVTAGGSDTISINNGTASSATSSNTSILTASVSNGAVTVSPLSAGSATVTITTSAGTTLTVTYTVSAAQQGGITNGYYYLDGTVSIDQNVTIDNPVVKVTNGIVKVCIDSSGSKFLVYSNGAVGANMYYLPNSRRSSILDAAVSSAAAVGTTLTYDSSDSSTWAEDFASTTYPTINGSITVV